jgi:hypothetical protein
VLRLRRQFFRPTDAARSYREIAGGLNQMRYSDFLRYVRETGWQLASLACNPFLRPRSLARRLSDAVTALPLVRDYAVHSVYATLRRPDRTREPCSTS